MKRIFSRGLAAVALAASVVGATDAHAQVSFFGAGGSARADFLASVSGAQNNNLDNESGSTLSLGALGSATVLGSGATILAGHLEGTGGGSSVAAYALSFTQSLSAFGADFSDLGTCCQNSPFPLGTLQLSFFNGATSLGTFSQVFSSPAASFFGVAGLAQFDRVEVRSNVGDVFYADNIAVAGPGGATSTVPEPTTYALLATGLVGLGVARRRRTHA